ncbi:MAG: hypothetical protein H6924_00610 [Alphaproteobacteria bacterium]|nr:hypothetical protein [Alphaproteobacteria bacterium]
MAFPLFCGPADKPACRPLEGARLASRPKRKKGAASKGRALLEIRRWTGQARPKPYFFAFLAFLAFFFAGFFAAFLAGFLAAFFGAAFLAFFGAAFLAAFFFAFFFAFFTGAGAGAAAAAAGSTGAAFFIAMFNSSKLTVAAI